ncbi:hypothetical protein CDAR_90311 [Caerostris darwini]|uniref:Uncharacterized protein n=1 Tax=Caerostris darwini TaxID=1538125 RepID=A0AAV4NS09_9ARAC|nr:hypothetical protein CDAR_90311 [Caerostris darwini]
MAWAVIDEALPINNSLRQEQAPNLLFLEGILLRRPGIFFPFHFVFFFPSFPSQIHCEGKGEIYYSRGNGTAFFDSSDSDCAGKKRIGRGEEKRGFGFAKLLLQFTRSENLHGIGEFRK